MAGAPPRRRRAARGLPGCVAGAAAVVASFVAARQALACAAPLLGGTVGWRFYDWRQVSDIVRGGTSKADFRGAKDTKAVAELSGTLEPVESSGSSFAGFVFQADDLPEDVTNLRALSLDVARGDGKEYTVSLKLRGSIADSAHKFRFRAEEAATIEMPFQSFVPYVRGKPVAQPAPPLKKDRIESIGIQIEGTEEGQFGPFILGLRGLSGVVGQEAAEKGPPPRETRWICKGCETMNPDSAVQCTRCGADRDVEMVEVVQERQAKAKKEKWECVDCGAKNFPASGECYKCGAQRG